MWEERVFMKDAYVAICYLCNENCRFCPCSEMEKSQKMITDVNEVIHTVNRLKNDGITDITISGGEPTLHPDFCEIISDILKKGMRATILTNSERFSDERFLEDFIGKVNTDKIKVITTLHSGNVEEHEKANRTTGSFSRSVKGLLNLSEKGIRIIIKHCVTKENYKDLKAFYSFCDGLFKESVDIQLCSIDYCGIPKNELENEMLSFVALRPYLEELFEHHAMLKNNGSKRYLYCIHMPLCACDVAFWNYFPVKKGKLYHAYKDPRSSELRAVSSNVGVHRTFCNGCKAYAICGGTYYSAFAAFGNRIVQPFV